MNKHPKNQIPQRTNRHKIHNDQQTNNTHTKKHTNPNKNNPHNMQRQPKQHLHNGRPNANNKNNYIISKINYDKIN